ncbi:helix-turn-helix domain-containing protein [Mycobacterium paragordonae]|uniref:helix-turn-helix domain-containing protein n=1 Tax=Mycobacterium paragordonae TaxID=1389713 RepID=UPI0010601A34|nr:helix-turn-helix domain-containing protein [Mycobacterium paragordonae]TDL05989.1 helix-turn-helix domain containing protein [Mycobacterium paragordonae]
MSNHISLEDRVARDERILALTRAGHSLTQIADFLGISPRTVHRVRYRNGLVQPTAPRLTDDELRTAKQLLADGASYSEVARTLGRSMEGVRSRCLGMSAWKPGSGAEYRRCMRALNEIDTAPKGATA